MSFFNSKFLQQNSEILIKKIVQCWKEGYSILQKKNVVRLCTTRFKKTTKKIHIECYFKMFDPLIIYSLYNVMLFEITKHNLHSHVFLMNVQTFFYSFYSWQALKQPLRQWSVLVACNRLPVKIVADQLKYFQHPFKQTTKPTTVIRSLWTVILC